MAYNPTSMAAQVNRGELVYNVKDYGAKGDRNALFTAAMTSGSANVTATLPSGMTWTSADIGKSVIVAGAGAAGATLRSTIVAVISTTQVTLGVNASTTVSNAHMVWGTDDTAAVQAAIDAATTPSAATYRSGEVFIPRNMRCMITSTIFARRWGGSLRGASASDWTSGASAGPYGSFLIWDGVAGSPMIQIENTRLLRIENLGLIGNQITDCRPSAILRFYTPDSSTVNGQFVVDNCVIGRYGAFGGLTATNASRVADNGIIADGSNFNNDRFRITGGRIEGCTTGISLPNSQSVVGRIELVTMIMNDTHISTAAQVRLADMYFGYSVVRDLDIFSSARVEVYQYASEIGTQLARMRGQSMLVIYGGYYQLTDTLVSTAARVVIDAIDDTRQVIRLNNMRFDNTASYGAWTAPTLIKCHAATNTALSNKLIEINNCRQEGSTNFGITPSWLDVTPVGTLESVTVFGNVQPAGAGNQNNGVQQFFWNLLRSTTDTVDFTRDDRITGANIQVFTSSGTWTKPAGVTTVRVVAIGSGGGGGSGRRGAAGTIRCGGGGGGGGGVTDRTMSAALLPGTVSVSIGAAGVGGAAVTTDDTNGNPGTSGISTTFGTYIRAGAGTLGSGGTNANGLAGTGGLALVSGGAGSIASTTGLVGGSAANSAQPGAAGGSAGGGIQSTDTANAGGIGVGSSSVNITTYAGGVVDSTLPIAAPAGTANLPLPGGSGGGGAASITTAAQSGVVGGIYGGGGSGGGASLNGNNSGAGGNGGPGIVVVIST